MRIKISCIFLITVLIPTIFLAYFGLQAIRSEKIIIEKSIVRQLEAMADIVESEAFAALAERGGFAGENPFEAELILLKQSWIFGDQVVIFNKKGVPIDKTSTKILKKAVISRPMKKMPYIIAVYPRHPLILEKISERRKAVFLYKAIIIFSALAIVGSVFFAFGALLREWRGAELKNEFVLRLSHDLRRPLTSIRMFSEMLKEGRVPEEEKRNEYYNIIAGESERLTQLANNILDFSRMEQGREKYNFAKEDVAKVVTDVVERFKTYILDKPCSVTFKLEGEIPAIIMDANLISQAIMNLLVNAAKFSPAGKEIKVTAREENNAVIIKISDQGRGLAAKDRKRVFKKFYRVSKKEIAEVEGSGLGLTLVKHIAEAHKGRVEVTSEEGKGSDFSLILPIRRGGS